MRSDLSKRPWQTRSFPPLTTLSGVTEPERLSRPIAARLLGMNDLVIARRRGEEEIGDIAHLAHEVESFDKHKAIGDHAWLDLVHGGRRSVYGFTARRKGESQLLGYAQVSVGNETWALELVVHPLYRGVDAGVVSALLTRSIREIASQGGGHVHVWLSSHDHDAVAALSLAGFTRGRTLVQMRRRLPLEPELQSDLITRPFICGQDEEAWLTVNNRAFARHPEQGGWTRDTLSSRQREPWFDPKGFLLHFENDRLIAFCWTKIHSTAEPPMGEIYVIGVDPDYNGRGIGRSMCIAGLEHLSSKRLPIAMLYVDADNTNAVAMYDRLGFHPDHVDTAYVADIHRA